MSSMLEDAPLRSTTGSDDIMIAKWRPSWILHLAFPQNFREAANKVVSFAAVFRARIVPPSGKERCVTTLKTAAR